MSQQAFTTVTLRRLPQGDTLQITISGDKSLSILWDKDTKQQFPVLSDTNSIKLTASVYGTSGTAATLSNCKWEMTDFDLSSIAKDGNVSGSVLEIVASPISDGATSVHSYIIKFTAKAMLNNHQYEVEKSVTLNCIETSQNSYWGSIESDNGTTFDGKISQIVLTPKLYIGTSETENEYVVEWQRNNVTLDGTETGITISGKNLIVKPDAVDGAAHFEAHFKVGGNEVEAEGVSIIDLTDEVQVVASGNSILQDTDTATITIKAYSSKTGSQLKITSIDTVAIEDGVRQRTLHNDYRTVTLNESTGVGTVTMEAKYMCVPFADKQIKGEWAICGNTASGDIKTTNIDEATQCEVNMLIGVSVNLN